jgi:2Fe-2S ferredoxin
LSGLPDAETRQESTMPRITFISHFGDRVEIRADTNQSLMQAAVHNGVQGIDGDCGGNCACATCHVYIEAPWADRLPPLASMENELLSATDDRRETSRLACQIELTADLDGLTVQLPLAQH